jgi:hypothetical protein
LADHDAIVPTDPRDGRGALPGRKLERIFAALGDDQQCIFYPWPLGIMQYQGQYGTDWGKVLAFVSLTLAPAVIFYLMAQKHIIAGLTSGAVKG